MAVEHRTPHHNPEAEQVVLGAVLKDNRALEIVRDIISVPDFYIHNHQVIFEAMLKLADEGTPIDLITLKDHLTNTGLLEEAGRVSYLWKLLDCTPTAGNARHYAGMIKDKTTERNISSTVDWLQEVVTDDQGDKEELEAVLSVLLRNVRHGASPTPTLSPISAYCQETRDDLKERVGGLATGFPNFDSRLFGLMGITILGAAPKVGKSVFALNVALNVAKAGGTVHYYDIENGRPLVMRRALSNYYSKTIEQLNYDEERGELWEADFDRDIPHLYPITDHARIKPDLIYREAQRAQADNILIVLDPLQELPPLEKQKRENIDRWLQEMLQIKQDPNITILLISTLSRGEKDINYRTPTLGAFKESGNIEYVADMALQFISDKGESGHMVLHCVANRHGPSGRIGKYSYENFKYWRWTEVPNRGDV